MTDKMEIYVNTMDSELPINLFNEQPESRFAGINKIRVVIIEDHEFTRLGIRTALVQHEKIEVVGEAANAKDGLEILSEVQPDIAILDIGLPDKNGIELTREIKATAFKETKVLILTLCDTKEAVLAAFAAGADSYCMKDIGYENLVEAIRITYKGEIWIDPTIARIVLEQAQKNAFRVEKVSLGSNRFVPQILDDSQEWEIIDLNTLTERELDVLRLIVNGCSNAAIATRLYISVGTVKSHVRNILNKLCASDRTQAAVHALRYGLLS